ncbi:MAG: DEAD/DEAH box helicase [Treponema sp.]|jgi:superfamily II DNA/RNA helicase|nr:DEAD/DEAH box helicase [Treponema sp.]
MNKGGVVSNFEELGVEAGFVGKLAGKNITTPTEIQRLVVPQLLQGKSVLFRSATGTGKTFAYLLPALQRITAESSAPYHGPALLVCAPTIELCSQIKNEIDFLSAAALNTVLLLGSMNINRQIDALKKNKPLAAVGNPGRLLLLAKMGKLKLGALSFLVLDEADRLAANDCREDMGALIEIITRSSNTLTAAACSATVSAKTRDDLSPLLANAALLETDEQEILRGQIEHWAIFSESRRKTQTLLSFLAAVKPKKALVFTGRSYDAGKVCSALQHRHIAAAGLYSGMDKQERKRAIDRFRSGKETVLVSSDLAARGLDIAGISHVIALDVSESKDAYIHRAGRTARAGKRGIMASIGDELEMRRLAALEKKLGIVIRPKELYGGRICAPEEANSR